MNIKIYIKGDINDFRYKAHRKNQDSQLPTPLNRCEQCENGFRWNPLTLNIYFPSIIFCSKKCKNDYQKAHAFNRSDLIKIGKRIDELLKDKAKTKARVFKKYNFFKVIQAFFCFARDVTLTNCDVCFALEFCKTLYLTNKMNNFLKGAD